VDGQPQFPVGLEAYNIMIVLKYFKTLLHSSARPHCPCHLGIQLTNLLADEMVDEKSYQVVRYMDLMMSTRYQVKNLQWTISPCSWKSSILDLSSSPRPSLLFNTTTACGIFSAYHST
jgi:hypothetical protein